MKSKTVCIKLATGEEIFAELMLDDDEQALDQNFLKLYQPYQVRVFNNSGKMNMMLSPWQVFSDDMIYLVRASHVVSINSLDEQHTQVYGAMVTNRELQIIQNEIASAAKMNTITKNQIDNSLKETLGVLMKSGIKYHIPMPELEEVKHDFYTFLMGQYENEVAVTH